MWKSFLPVGHQLIVTNFVFFFFSFLLFWPCYIVDYIVDNVTPISMEEFIFWLRSGCGIWQSVDTWNVEDEKENEYKIEYENDILLIGMQKGRRITCLIRSRRLYRAEGKVGCIEYDLGSVW